MSLEVIQPPRLYRQVAEQIRALIEDGAHDVGDRLPSERELAERLGLSRPTIREALIALEVEGRVQIRVGSGIYVTDPPAQTGARPTAEDEGPFEILAAREILEGAVAGEAASLAGPGDVAALDAILSQVGADGTPSPEIITLDRAFHVAVASIVGNAVLERQVGELFDLRMTPFFKRLADHFETNESWRTAHLEHGEVRDAIAAGDPVAASAAMRRHLQASQRRFQQSFGDPDGREEPGEPKGMGRRRTAGV